MKFQFVTLLLVCMILGYQAQAQSEITFNPNTMKTTIQALGKSWSQGLKNKNIETFRSLYDENAHYLPDGEEAIQGHENIAQYWRASWDFIRDIELTMETLEGSEQLLYETGTGVAKIMNQQGGLDAFRYKYVNVWKKQKDGSYKVVIDMYNDIPK